MKAILYRKYGTTDDLVLEEVPRRSPNTNEVLIKVRATSINAWDWDLLRGNTFLVRLDGLFRPRYNILGADVARIVVETGGSVTRFKPCVVGIHWEGQSPAAVTSTKSRRSGFP